MTRLLYIFLLIIASIMYSSTNIKCGRYVSTTIDPSWLLHLYNHLTTRRRKDRRRIKRRVKTSVRRSRRFFLYFIQKVWIFATVIISILLPVRLDYMNTLSICLSFYIYECTCWSNVILFPMLSANSLHMISSFIICPMHIIQGRKSAHEKRACLCSLFFCSVCFS
jgi:hypothetical protein